MNSSPYNRVMRKFNNYMKDTPSFQQDEQGYEEYRFPPFSAWMVFTDMDSHASLSEQYAFVLTGIVRLENCHLTELAPINVLRQAPISNWNLPRTGILFPVHRASIRSIARFIRSITSSISIRFITPSSLIRVPQRKFSGFLPRKRRAASANLSTQRSSEL